MNVKQLKDLIADMDDDAEVLTRGRDCVGGLYWVETIKHPSKPAKNGMDLKYLHHKDTIGEVYGGEGMKLDGQAIIFVESD